MSERIPKTLDELMERVLDICPNAILDDDGNGQIVVYTNMRIIENTKDDLEDMSER